jgi:uncharacterized membrane protein
MRFFEDPEFYRIQMILLALAAVATLLCWITPLAYLEAPLSQSLSEAVRMTSTIATAYGTGIELAGGMEYRSTMDFAQRAGFGLAMGSILGGLFYYKQRKRQAQFCLMAIIALIAGLVCAIANIYMLQQEGPLKELSAITSGYGMNFPFGAALLLILARRNILRDEAKVRSMDRFW